MERMSISYIIMLVGASILLVGFITTMAAPNAENVTTINKTIPVITETPALIDTPAEEEELTPEEAMAIREGEIAEEAALTEEESENAGEPIIEDVVSIPDESISEPVDTPVEDVVEPTPATGTPIFVQESSNDPVKNEVSKTSLKKTVNGSGFVFVGTEYAGKDVVISF